MKPIVALNLILILALSGCAHTQTKPCPVQAAAADPTVAQAEQIRTVVRTALAPVYPYLADYIVDRFQLADQPGIGVDIGGGPGRLVMELGQRTAAYYWINADINPHHAGPFYREASTNGCASRVALLVADVHHLPFRDDYADLVVSRGSFPFWDNPPRGFAEIYRILKPGGRALIGRGFPPNLPLETARQIRLRQGEGMPKYDVPETVENLRLWMKELQISDYEILRPRADQTEVNYGVWVFFAKPPR